MRVVFGLLGQVLVLLIVGNLTMKQLGATRQIQLPPAAGAPAPATDANTNVREQSEQMQQQVKKALEGAMQARPVPDDK